MNYKIPLETSARHIHLCREDFEALFDHEDLTPVKELSQPGQYLAKERLTVLGQKGKFENVGIIGPLRKDTQMEISITDCRKLGVPVVIRQSGDIEGTPGMTLVSEKGSITKEKGVIVAQRHIHMTPMQALQMHVKDKEEVFVIVESFNRSLIYGNVIVRVSRDFELAMHIDTDEANAFAGAEDTYGVLVKMFGGVTSYNLSAWTQELLEGINRR